MKKRYVVLLVIPLLVACFEDQPQLPQFHARQNVEVTIDSMICFSGDEDFSYFQLNCSATYDSVHWYGENWNGSAFLGNDNPLLLSVDDNLYANISCMGFSGTDTTIYALELNYCGRDIYIPTAFNWWYPPNPAWAPVVNVRNADYTIYWEIRNLDGIKLFETTDRSAKWNGTYNGQIVPRGSYLYYIELTVSGEEKVVYTGWLELLG